MKVDDRRILRYATISLLSYEEILEIRPQVILPKQYATPVANFILTAHYSHAPRHTESVTDEVKESHVPHFYVFDIHDARLELKIS